MGKDGAEARRVTTTLSRETKDQLERLAEREHLSESWLVRRAVEQFLDQFKTKPVVAAKGEMDAGR